MTGRRTGSERQGVSARAQRLALISALARAIRCRCPPESSAPRSPTSVWYPSGSSSMNSCAFAALQCSGALTSSPCSDIFTLSFQHSHAAPFVISYQARPVDPKPTALTLCVQGHNEKLQATLCEHSLRLFFPLQPKGTKYQGTS